MFLAVVFTLDRRLGVEGKKDVLVEPIPRN